MMTNNGSNNLYPLTNNTREQFPLQQVRKGSQGQGGADLTTQIM